MTSKSFYMVFDEKSKKYLQPKKSNGYNNLGKGKVYQYPPSDTQLKAWYPEFKTETLTIEEYEYEYY